MKKEEINKMPITNKSEWGEADYNHLSCYIMDDDRNLYQAFGYFCRNDEPCTIHSHSKNSLDEGIHIIWDGWQFGLMMDNKINITC